MREVGSLGDQTWSYPTIGQGRFDARETQRRVGDGENADMWIDTSAAIFVPKRYAAGDREIAGVAVTAFEDLRDLALLGAYVRWDFGA